MSPVGRTSSELAAVTRGISSVAVWRRLTTESAPNICRINAQVDFRKSRDMERPREEIPLSLKAVAPVSATYCHHVACFAIAWPDSQIDLRPILVYSKSEQSAARLPSRLPAQLVREMTAVTPGTDATQRADPERRPSGARQNVR
jgi:hypothetical protein